MPMEHDLQTLLDPFVGGRLHWDVAPLDVPKPYAIVTQAGGRAKQYVDGSRPDHKHARLQIEIWADSRPQANALARAVEDAIAAQAALGWVVQVYGALTALHEQDLKLYGTRQDFGIWFKDPPTANP